MNAANALTVSVLVGMLAGCDPEDVGLRLRRECTSIVREANANRYISESSRESEIRDCIAQRGRAGR